MVAVEDFVEAFEICITRLSDGESVDTIVQDYPELAAELRPMLEAGLLLPRARYPLADVNQAQGRVQAQVQAQLQSGINFIWWIIGIVLLIMIIIIAIIALNPPQSEVVPSVPTETTLSPYIQIEGELLFDENGASINDIAIDDSQIDLPDSGSVRLTGELIDGQIIANEVENITADQTPASIVIEGAVEAITTNIVTIYGFDIAIEEDNPLLSVIQIGDVLRIEGEEQTQGIYAFTVIFISVDVYINGSAVWRDSGNCVNAPPPWATATAWHLRCSPNSPVNTGSTGRGRSQSSGSS